MSDSPARDPFLQTMKATPFAIDRKRLAAQQICDDLRERILGLELKPGTGLSRPALAEFYRVSQTPIRDAILKLEQEGLVEIRSEEHTSELQSLMRISYAVFCMKKKKPQKPKPQHQTYKQ